MREHPGRAGKRIAATAARTRRGSHPLQRCCPVWNRRKQRQLEANRRHWDRCASPPSSTELASEPERIRELYHVKAQRIEPVGLVYLWPVTG